LEGDGKLLRVRDAVARLWALPSTDELTSSATVELCGCGFDRALLSRVDGSGLTLVSAWVAGDCEASAGLLVTTRVEGRPAGARVVLGDDGRSAVVPVMLSGRVAGYFHVDRQLRQREVRAAEVEVIVAFAEGFAHAYERSVLRDRLRVVRIEVRRANEALAVSTEGAAGSAVIGFERSAPIAAIGLEAALTKREIEVVRLVAAGRTNAAIAAELVVSEGTVKSHVRHILHKLHAKNRAEAASLYGRLSLSSPRPLGGSA
jgi:DNA-binding NarL/FixJ family response regulator